ncbi:MAG: hypothetical protein Q9162_006937 [Coniocarpon cinnabarinum]
MIEAFEWYSPADGQHWKKLERTLPLLSELGVDKIWIPPACKAGSCESNGYDTYDLYDLGEFDQKGTVATKWGSKDELVDLCRAAKSHGIGIIFDAVLGHKAAADYTQHVKACRIDPADRRKALEKPQEIEAWLGYNYDARGGKYSQMKYNAEHFNATSYDNATQTAGIFKLADKEWAQDVDKSNGNYDYLYLISLERFSALTTLLIMPRLCNNLDLSHMDTRKDLYNWANWVVNELDLGGFRLDAVKHISQDFMSEFLRRACQKKEPNWLVVGEYCTGDNVKTLTNYINKMNRQMSLFDFPLVRNFAGISQHADADLRHIFGGTLSGNMPKNAVTFVTNHDTQEREDENDPSFTIATDFIPVAYAVILLNLNSGYPCLFWGDLFGVGGPKEPKAATDGTLIARLAVIRQLYAYGPQNEYFDDQSCVGFTRTGDKAHSSGAGVAVLISKSNQPQTKRMKVGRQHAGEQWSEALGGSHVEVDIDSKGFGVFPIEASQGSGEVTVWIDSAAPGRERVESVHLVGQDQ